jgi:DNA invertase Pin-like site-specific DNA recombinase
VKQVPPLSPAKVLLVRAALEGGATYQQVSDATDIGMSTVARIAQKVGAYADVTVLQERKDKRLTVPKEAVTTIDNLCRCGFTTREIASALSISQGTVCNAKNRVHAYKGIPK